MAPPRTVPDVLTARLRRRPGDPLVTFYDLATGERVELSTTTWANWTAKVAGLLTDDLDLVAGDRLLLDVGPHWQSTVVLGGAWQAGVEVVVPHAGAGRADVDVPAGVEVVFCDQARAPAYATAVAGTRVTVLALSLAPMAGPCGALPDGVLDFAREVPSQPDAYLGLEHPTGDSPAWSTGEDALDHVGLLGSPRDERVLSVTDPAGADGVRLLGSLLAGDGSLVLVRTHGAEVPASLPAQENVDAAPG